MRLNVVPSVGRSISKPSSFSELSFHAITTAVAGLLVLRVTVAFVGVWGGVFSGSSVTEAALVYGVGVPEMMARTRNQYVRPLVSFPLV